MTVFFCAADPVGDGLFKEGKSPSWGPLSPAVQKGELNDTLGWWRHHSIWGGGEGRAMNPIGRVPLPLDRGSERCAPTLWKIIKPWVVRAEAQGKH